MLIWLIPACIVVALVTVAGIALHAMAQANGWDEQDGPTVRFYEES